MSKLNEILSDPSPYIKLPHHVLRLSGLLFLEYTSVVSEELLIKDINNYTLTGKNKKRFTLTGLFNVDDLLLSTDFGAG